MKEKFDRNKKPTMTIEEIAEKAYNEKVKNMTKEEQEKYDKKLIEYVERVLSNNGLNTQRVDKIDGITVVCELKYEYNKLERPMDHLIKYHNIPDEYKKQEVFFYDEQGNIFYKNVDSNESAQKLILELAEGGITALTGRPSPIVSQNGLISRKDSGLIGIYIEKEEEKVKRYKEM